MSERSVRGCELQALRRGVPIGEPTRSDDNTVARPIREAV
ncbi:hypothetical protein HNR40_000177 [Nonomuraea endophytica]|uniref:Uncharacterized protein n=1 Tax=Nonomuraea endophytica TaxID=714136 RepID=A0A7W7ZVX0_9ACTN|nr:hypothetical protein [Nonomuraea endophytica]